MVDECDSKMVVVSKMVHELLLERGEISADTSPQMLVELDMDPDAIVGVLMMMIKTLYGPIALNVRKEVARAVAAQVRRDNIPPKATAEQGELQQQLLSAFIQLEYRGDADKRLLQHLETCWEAYTSAPRSFTAPLTSILQSSGSGKSRSLQKLAENTCKTEASEGLEMRVLYMCMRDQGSTGFPRPTQRLGYWLFGSDQTEVEMSEKLVGTLSSTGTWLVKSGLNCLRVSRPTKGGCCVGKRAQEEADSRLE